MLGARPKRGSLMRTAAPSLALLLFALPAAAAPVPKLKAPPDFYPSAVGTKWVYGHDDGTSEHTREVTASDTKDGVTTFTVTWTEGGTTQLWELKKEAGAVYRTKQDRWAFDPAHKLLEAKMAAGDEWTSEYSYGGGKYKYTRTVGKAEVVKTPAGEFTAMPIISRNQQIDGDETTLWYADGVGLVALQHKNSQRIVLREFTRGK
jgi:hypothetical protein